jgi:type IV pilus assembly protein PilW
VMMQAMYGKDTNGDGKVDTYEKSMPSPATNADWKNVLSVRIAVVARSNQFEKDVVTSTVPVWDVGSAIAVTGAVSCNGGSKCLSLDVSTLADWQHYRYKVYDTIVPLRNALWNDS